MNTNSNDFSRNMREALEKYESRFSLPENFISAAMTEIERRCERRSNIRSVIAVTSGVLFLLLCGVGALLYLPLPAIMPETGLPAMPDIPLGHTLRNAAVTAGDLLADPLVGMTVVIAAILLALDRITTRRSSQPSEQ